MVFSLRQLQEKCREEQMPLYIAFIDLTKAFDLLSRSGLLELLRKIGCPPHLLAIITSFHENMHSAVCFNGATSEAFPVSSEVKQGSVVASTLLGIFFSMLLQYTFKDCREGVYIHTRAVSKLFNITPLRAKTKVTHVLIRKMLFADTAAFTFHTEDDLRQLVRRLSHACKRFDLTISIKKINVIAQNSDHPRAISIERHMLKVVDLPRVHHLQHTQHRGRGAKQDCQSSSSHGQANQDSVEQLQPDFEDQTACRPGMGAQHSSLWQ